MDGDLSMFDRKPPVSVNKLDFVKRPEAKPRSGIMDALFGGGKSAVRDQARENIAKSRFETVKKKLEKTDAKKNIETSKRYFNGNSAQFGKFAPSLAEQWEKAMPDSFNTRERGKETMQRVFGAIGAKRADSYVGLDKLKGVHKAVKENRWNDPTLKGLNAEEKKRLQYNPEMKMKFLQGIERLDKKFKK
jgi:hypothetical protein